MRTKDDIEPRHRASTSGYSREVFTDHLQHFDSAQDLGCRTVTTPYSEWPTACLATRQHQPHKSPNFAIEPCPEESVGIQSLISRR